MRIFQQVKTLKRFIETSSGSDIFVKLNNNLPKTFDYGVLNFEDESFEN